MSRDPVFTTRTDREDGFDLRAVAFGDEVVLARLYFAARDPLWRTVPLRAVRSQRTTTPDGFAVVVEAVSESPVMPMSVTIEYRAAGDELVARAVAVAGGDFDYNRVGLCLLLDSAAYRGRTGHTRSGDTSSSFTFPEPIVTRAWTDENAVRFHDPFDALETELASGTRVRLELEGARFELEDQRNWTDPSYKAYSASDEPWPLRAHAGERFAQVVRLRVAPGPRAPREDDGHIALAGTVGTLPPVGVYTGRVAADSLRPAGGFEQLNSARGAGDTAPCAVELAVNGAVHASDDDSVLEATSTHGELVRQARAICPGTPVHLAPIAFLDEAGDWRGRDGDYRPEPPTGSTSRRWAEALAATWVVASVAGAAPAGVASLRYFSPDLPAGSPAAEVIERLAHLEGRELLEVTAPPPLAALAVVTGEGCVTLAVANASPDRQHTVLPDGTPVELAPFAAQWFEVSYAVAQRAS